MTAPRTTSTRFRKHAKADMLRRLAEQMTARLGRAPTDAELASMLAVSVARIAAIRSEGR
jgi:DNA-directed RNA polymerase specialized sigma subunit